MSTKITFRIYHILLWIIALSLIGYHTLMAFFTWNPVSFWIEYHSVKPLKDTFKVNERLKFVSHSDLNRNVILTFNDILFCKNEVGDFERYSEQNTSRLHNEVGEDRYTVWPYSPGVAYETECCLESNINLHLPMHTDRALRFDGCLEGITFKVKGE